MSRATWANDAVVALLRGETPRLQAFGNSMRPRVLSGSWVTLRPLLGAPAVGDIVLANVGDHVTLHGVREVRDGAAMIADERGNVDGWVPFAAIFGVVASVEAP